MVSTQVEKRNMPQRARREEDKEARRQQLLEAARALFEGGQYEEVKMADVAERAGLAKGTVFLYFPTKEALFLALLEQELFRWMGKLEGELRGEGRWKGEHLARVVVESLRGEEMLTRLLARLQTVLEQNVTEEQVRGFKERLLEAMVRVGGLVEKRLPFLAAGEGVRFMLHTHALVTGLRQMADMSPVVHTVLADERLAPLRVDFTQELTLALKHHLRGLESR